MICALSIGAAVHNAQPIAPVVNRRASSLRHFHNNEQRGLGQPWVSECKHRYLEQAASNVFYLRS